jgi:hypothetical protein
MVLTIGISAARTEERRKLRIDGIEGSSVSGDYGGKDSLLIRGLDRHPEIAGAPD